MDFKPLIDICDLQVIRTHSNFNYSINGLLSGNDSSMERPYFEMDALGLQHPLLQESDLRQRLISDPLISATELSRDARAICYDSFKTYRPSSPVILKSVRPCLDPNSDLNLTLVRPAQASTINLLKSEALFAPAPKHEGIFSIKCSESLNGEKETGRSSEETISRSEVVWSPSLSQISPSNSANTSSYSPLVSHSAAAKRKQRRYR